MTFIHLECQSENLSINLVIFESASTGIPCPHPNILSIVQALVLQSIEHIPLKVAS